MKVSCKFVGVGGRGEGENSGERMSDRKESRFH